MVLTGVPTVSLICSHLFFFFHLPVLNRSSAALMRTPYTNNIAEPLHESTASVSASSFKWGHVLFPQVGGVD